MAGKLIVIDGIDSSGKNTQMKKLQENLTKRGIKSISVSFPQYDTPTGKIIAGPLLGREDVSSCWFLEGATNIDPYIACLYYAADRKYNIPKVKEYIENDYYVILDRYVSSNMAHQGSKILDKDERFHMFQWIDKLEYWLLGLPKPDKTIFLHMPYLQAMELAKKRNKLDDVEKSEEHMRQSEITYIELSELYNWDRVECIDEFGNVKTVDTIADEINKLID